MAWSNQTLVMVVLWAITVYLASEKKFYWITLLPALFMTTVTSSYLMFALEGFGLPYVVSVFSGLLCALGAGVLFFRKINKKKHCS